MILTGSSLSKHRPHRSEDTAPLSAVSAEAGLAFKLWHRPSAVSAPLELSDQGGLTADHCRLGSGKKMKRSHNYSSSESDLDDNVDVEKDSGDENGYVHFLYSIF